MKLQWTSQKTKDTVGCGYVNQASVEQCHESPLTVSKTQEQITKMYVQRITATDEKGPQHLRLGGELTGQAAQVRVRPTQQSD